jgi:hypothetical protein
MSNAEYCGRSCLVRAKGSLGNLARPELAAGSLE